MDRLCPKCGIRDCQCVEYLKGEIERLEAVIKDEAIEQQWCMTCDKHIFEMEAREAELVELVKDGIELIKFKETSMSWLNRAEKAVGK